MRSRKRGIACVLVLSGLILVAQNAMAADLSQAIGLMESKDYAAAEPLLREVLVDEEEPQARYLLGFLLIETYRLEEAEQQLRRAVAARPQQHHWMMALAKSLLEQDKNIAAGEVLERAIALAPKPAYHHAHAMTAINSGQLAAAEASLRTCLAQAPNHGDALFRLGRLLVDQGRDEEGITVLERARAANPQNVETIYRLGTAYRHAGRFEAAESLLAAVVEAVPGHVGALHNLSRVLIQSGRREEAAAVLRQFSAMSDLHNEIDHYAAGLRKNPRNIEARLQLASLYLRAGRTTEAVSELLRARRVAPRDARIYRSLAETYRRLGDDENAARAEQFMAGLKDVSDR